MTLPRKAGFPTRRGLMLLELLFAAAVFVTFFILVMSTWPVNAAGIQKARHLVLATNLAQEQMELCVQQGFSRAASVPQTTLPVTTTVNNVTDTMTFTWQVTVTLISGTTDEKDVTVTVSWQEGKVTSSVRQETLLCNL